ncbi:Na/K/2Cl co-transporter [Reticulomyxa filosa]|uniref:Na/K/2Cl co-transporter n=1 Tax=Reticulomyxa filosa TaxID=46433 RepID=X6N0J8_RETFI|nr:Na/K/2Cl co-transporter [Reticulomyxa filosa]|eukprot:ETO19393.1 Na/K/2Cl co-transporter [Reticulomyxa filosa]
MLATRLDYAVVAIITGASIYGYVSYSKPNVNWGSAFESRAKWKVGQNTKKLFFSIANRAVLQLMHYKAHVKNFQPSFLVMCGNPETRIPLVKFVYTLQRGHGMIIYANVINGDFTQHISEIQQNTSYLPEEMKMQAFFENVAAPTVRKGAHALFQLAGLGKLRGNVLVLGFKNQWHHNIPIKAQIAERQTQTRVDLEENALSGDQKEQNSNINESFENDQGSHEKQSLLASTSNSSDTFSNDDYVALLMDALKYKMGFMICRGLETLPLGEIKSGNVIVDLNELSENSLFRSTAVIDVWWLLDDGGLSLLVPHLMSIDRFWRQLSSMNATPKEKNTFSNRNNTKVPKDLSTRDARFMVRLFLVADDDIGADGLDQATTGNQGKHQRQTSSMQLQELARISRQGLVAEDLIGQIENTTDLWKAELSSLLQKFRLNINGPYTVKSGRREPSMETYEKFAQLTGYQLNNKEHSHVWSNSKLNRWLRVSEMIHAYSRNQRCVFVTAPFPTCFDESTMYLGVLDMLSHTTENRATVLIRGTGDNVLTFYSE